MTDKEMEQLQVAAWELAESLGKLDAEHKDISIQVKATVMEELPMDIMDITVVVYMPQSLVNQFKLKLNEKDLIATCERLAEIDTQLAPGKWRKGSEVYRTLRQERATLEKKLQMAGILDEEGCFTEEAYRLPTRIFE